MKDDALLLRDTVQSFINTSISAFGMNPLYSHSTPSFTWKAGLKYTGVELDFITDDKLRI